ncbi:MAG: hypothetical protein KKE23_02120 [Nanoarchaeota archaeon]|nr:hypothetical protein [Nanoarchaeota archaeon]
MGNEDYQKEYQKDMQHLSEAFREDEPMTFKGVISDLWEEAKNIGKVWAIMGPATVGLIAGIATYMEYDKKVFIQNLVPTLKNKILAETVYAYNPSKKNKENYFRGKEQLENLIKERKKLSEKNMGSFLENQGYFYLSLPCKNMNTKGENLNCKHYLGKILTQVDISELSTKKPVGYLYSVETGSDGINLTGGPLITTFKNADGTIYSLIEVDSLKSTAKNVSENWKDYLKNNEYFEKNDPRADLKKQAIYKSIIDDLKDGNDPKNIYSVLYNKLRSSVGVHEENHFLEGVDKDSPVESEIKANLSQIRQFSMGLYTLEKWSNSEEKLYRDAYQYVYEGLKEQAKVKTKKDLYRLSPSELSKCAEQAFKKRYHQEMKVRNYNWKSHIRKE